ncbi:MAG: ATP synthase subunit I [Cellvibrionaceae bacterium]|nr:ATP synthase subunit I [Cellvibrionaceae bacterium]
MGKSVKQLIIQLWLLQLGGLVLISILLWWPDPVMAYSVFAGGILYWLPNAYFTLCAFRYPNESWSEKQSIYLLRSIYRGEAYKFIVTVVGFATVFLLVEPLNSMAVFIAFIVMTLSQWLLVGRWQIQ